MSGKNGTETVSASLPGNIIDLLDKCAGVQDLSRSKVIERAIKHYLLSAHPEMLSMGASDFWDKYYQDVFNKS